MLLTLRLAISRKLRTQLPLGLFQLRCQPIRQFAARRFRSRSPGGLRVFLSFRLNFFEQVRGFLGHRVGGRFSRCRLDLLLGIGHQSRQLPRQL